MRYFVMLNSMIKLPTPMTQGPEGERVALFDTEEDANSHGAENPLGRTYGYEVYEWLF